MHFTRYTWAMLLVVAAALAANLPTVLTLLLAGGCALLLTVGREKQLQRLVRDLSDLLSIPTSSGSISLEQELSRVRRRMIALAAGAETVILLALLLGNLDITVARNYCLLALVALAPLGLEVTLALLVRSRHNRTSETVRTAVHYAIEDAYTLLLLLGLSLAGTLFLHIPAALSALQILLITCVARPLLSGRLLQAAPHQTDQRWRVLFGGLVTYGSFVFFFIRHYVNPRYADSINATTWQATSVALLTFVLCQALPLLLNPRLPRRTMWRTGLLTLLLCLAVYLPPLQHYFMTNGLTAADWAWVLIAGLVNVSLVLLAEHVSSSPTIH